MLQSLCTQIGPRLHLWLLLLLLCLPAAAKLYIVVSYDVVTMAVVLEIHACVG